MKIGFMLLIFSVLGSLPCFGKDMSNEIIQKHFDGDVITITKKNQDIYRGCSFDFCIIKIGSEGLTDIAFENCYFESCNFYLTDSEFFKISVGHCLSLDSNMFFNK